MTDDARPGDFLQLEPIPQPLYDRDSIPVDPFILAEAARLRAWWAALPWWSKAYRIVMSRLFWSNPLARAIRRWLARREQRRRNMIQWGNPEGRCGECGGIHSIFVLH